ncbi:MAG: ribonuclease HI [Armatimonadetes bacterium]|nr:ribonuclease HI [Armatimonadota bacterium]
MRRLQQIDLYTDGACPGNGKGPCRTMGIGIVARAGAWEREWSLSLGPGTNQKAELLAIREALLRIKDRSFASVRVFTDSEYAIGCLVKGWKVKVNKELVDEVRALIAECGRFEMVKVPAHAGDPANERADRLAVDAARKASGTVEQGASSP